MDQRTLLAIILSLFLVVAYQSVMEIYFPPDEIATHATSEEKSPSVSGQETLPEKQPSPAAGTSVPVVESQPVVP